MRVRFTKIDGPYNPGDVASFPRKEAEAKIKAGTAVHVNDPAQTAPPKSKQVKAAPDKASEAEKVKPKSRKKA